MGNLNVADSTGQLKPGKGKSHVIALHPAEEFQVVFTWTGSATAERPQFLEYKKDGLLGAINKWIKVPLDPTKRKIKLSLPEGKYQSRWAIGEGKWLSPDVRVPGLMAKLLQNPKIKLLAEGLKMQDFQVCDLPDGPIKTGLLKIEDLLPANKWALKTNVDVEIGRFVDGNLVLTQVERAKKAAQAKMRDPKFRKAAKKAAKKAAIAGVKLAIKQIGISLDSIIDEITSAFDFDALSIDLPDIDLPSFNVPDVSEQMKTISNLIDEKAEEEEGDDENVESMKSWQARFPRCRARVPLKFEWLAPGQDVAVEVFSINDKEKKKTLIFTKKAFQQPKPMKDKDGKEIAAEPVPVPENFYGGWECETRLPPGNYGFRHAVDSKLFTKYSKDTQHHDNAFRVIAVSIVQPTVV